MPVKITKIAGGKYRVSTPGGTKAKHTTKKKAMAQERLLNAMEHNPEFKKRMEARKKKMQKEMGMSKGTKSKRILS